ASPPAPCARPATCCASTATCRRSPCCSCWIGCCAAASPVAISCRPSAPASAPASNCWKREMALALLLFVTVQRLWELVHARRNTSRLLAEGAVEIGAGHYPLLVLLHAAWLASLWIWLAAGRAELIWPVALAYLLVQLFRVWVMASLGRYW